MWGLVNKKKSDFVVISLAVILLIVHALHLNKIKDHYGRIETIQFHPARAR
jgi:hypothetical protein